MLLQWCTLEPSGPSQLAALRFASPVRIQSIAIFPSDYHPFANKPDVVSRTEPDAFFLELYFNAHPVSHPNVKEKAKPTNVLSPTVIAYAGGCMQFPLNMGLESATRLMIVKGSFQVISLAIYGEIVAERLIATSHKPRHIPVVDPIPLHSSLDPASFRDPTKLAKQLLQLIPDAPPLPLVIRLMLCLKPANDDWDLPDFPYLHSELDEFTDTSDIEHASSLTTRPVADDTAHAILQSFAQRVGQAIGPKDDMQSYNIAKLLGHVACQHPELARALMDNVDFTTVFDVYNLDEDTLERLLDATANTDVARLFNAPWFLDLLTSIHRDGNAGRELRTMARRLLFRLEGMPVLEDAILNTQGDFVTAALTIKDILTQERSLGVWLASMITHQDLVDKLSENPPLSVPLQYPPLLFTPPKTSVKHDEFVAFLRAVVGVCSVLAVYAWADSLPDQHCRERALGILRLWQGVDGYREILNHVLLLRQMTFRLECMLENEVPTTAGIDAEYILLGLAKDPHAILNPELTKSILSLNPPHCVITLEERLSMREAALIADDGLTGAVDYVLQPIEQPPTLRSVRALRVALAIISRELLEVGEHEVLDEFWSRGTCSLQTCLADAFVDLNQDICKHFTVKPSPSTPSDLIAELFRASDQAVGLLLRLLPNYPLPGRVIRAIVSSAADLFVCTDVIDLVYAQTSPTCIAAQDSRQSCIDVVRSLTETPEETKGVQPNADVVLRTLLEHGLKQGDREPAHHLLQVFCLIDFLLPMPDDVDDATSNIWIQHVLPNMLRELWAFCAVLDTENKAHFVRRLVGLDQGVIGIGDWLLQQELKDLLQNLESLDNVGANAHHRLLRQYQVSLSLRFLLDLLGSSPPVSGWCCNALIGDPDAAHMLALCLEKLGEHNLVSAQLTKLLHILVADPASLDDEVKLPLALTLLRTCQYGDVTSSGITSSLYLAHTILITVQSYLVRVQNVAFEISSLLHHLSVSPTLIVGDLPDALLGVLEWLDSSDDPGAKTIHGISTATFVSLCSKLREQLSPERQPQMDALQSHFKFPAQEAAARPTAILPEKVELSVQDLENLLRIPTPPPSTPPRRLLNQDILSTVAVSPPTAVIRSPAATGLTKTYLNNDFRQLRQAPSARQNTSRLPSMHVDDFENAAASSSPTLLPLPMSVPIPLMAGTTAMPFAAAAPPTFSPIFKLL